jgi:hypothetical protein
LQPVVLGLAAESGEFGFLQVYPQVEGVQRHPRGFAVGEAVYGRKIQPQALSIFNFGCNLYSMVMGRLC